MSFERILTWIGPLSFMATIIGIIIAIIFYTKSKREKKPRYNIKGVTLINSWNSLVDKIKILYEDKPIENLSITKVAFWNAGRETIRGNDIASTQPIIIYGINGAVILNSKIIYEAEKTNAFELISDDSFVKVEFEYIDKNQGAIIEVTHTGFSWENIGIKGTIISYGQFTSQEKEDTQKYLIPLIITAFRELPGRWIFGILFFITLPLSYILECIFPNLSQMRGSIHSGSIYNIMIGTLVTWALALFFLLPNIKDRMPKGFDKFMQSR